jgi:hypothetical protein
MTSPKPRSRFLPTLTEVVRPGGLASDETQAPAEVKVPAMVPPSAAAQNSRALFALQQELSHALQAQLHAMLNAQIQQIVPQLHESIDAAVQEAVAKAIVARIAAAD